MGVPPRRGSPLRSRLHTGVVTAIAVAVMLATSACVPEPSEPVSGEACLDGQLVFDYPDAEAAEDVPVVTEVAHGVDWELWGSSEQGAELADLIATGQTDATDGSFEACSDTPLAVAFLRFPASSMSHALVFRPDDTDEVVAFETESFADVAGTVDVGEVVVPEEVAPAWKILDTLFLLYDLRDNDASDCWTSRQQSGSCDQIEVVWDPDGSGDVAYVDGETRQMHIGGEGPRSRHLILHEAAHWWMWQLYGREFPDIENCEIHQYELASSSSCAWSEGFANAVASYVLGSYGFIDYDGSYFDYENDATTPGWDAGDAVEIRVASSLLDLWAPDGPDGGDWDETIEVMLLADDPHVDFYDYFFNGRPMVGLPTTGEVLEILRRHTIEY